MRKSERLRLLEIQVVKLEMQVELLSSYVVAMLESQEAAASNLDAGKWYNRNNP